ncbi:MAG: GNAT family N-acetyltransferase [Solirubrobacterales bacterium]
MRVYRAGPERLNDIEPLWKEMHEHHATISSYLGETRSPEESWERRRERYREWLSDDDGFLLIAEIEGDGPVGYGVVHFEPGSEVWRTGDLIAKVQTLCVLPEHRGLAVGSALIEAGRSILKPLGIREASFSCMVTNEEAIAMFESFGVQRTMVSFRAMV